MENKPNIELMLKNMMMIWAALFSSQVMFILVAFAVKPELMGLDPAKPLSGENPAVVGIFAILAITLIVASFVIRTSFRNRAVTEQSPALLQTGMLVSCAMCEFASIFGLLLAISYDYQYFIAFIVLGMAGMVFHFPTRASLMASSFGKKL